MALPSRSYPVSSPDDAGLSSTPSKGFAAQMQASTATTPSTDDGPQTPRQHHVPPGVEVDVRDKHKRSYQACNECRARKIKCDQGPVDNPIPPPCARCRRENRPCTFSATRRKNPKKRKMKDEDSADEEDSDGERYQAPASEEEDPVAVLQQHETMSGLDSLNILGLAAARISAASATTDPNSKSQSQLAAWERLSFVRRELFSAQDGINYVNYFFDRLYPLTPILIPDFQNNQIELLENEPVLLVVILTIASRYMPLTGPGAMYRQTTIHEQLWNYLRRLIEKILWAQEKYGSSKTMRTLGTVEGLLLLTEWNPRGLHSPISEDDELMAPQGRPKRRRSDSNAAYLLNRNNGLQEPCWRSDRMSWMLLSHANGIAFELGAFDNAKEHGSRAKYVRILLPIYFIQLAGRLELIGSLPQNYLNSLNSTELNFRDVASFNEPKLGAVYFWKQLTGLMKQGNEELYANREKTRALIKSRQYINLLEHTYRPQLNHWLAEFERGISSVPPLIGAILRIEYEYTRVYINSLALQAIVDRCANSSPAQRHISAVGFHSRTNSGSTKTIPSHLFDKCIGEDRKYLDEITDGCRNVLKIVLGLGPDLKFLSVRTFFRVIAVTVILLKTFALGAKENNILLSIEQMKQLIAAINDHIVDDIHIGNRFAHTCNALIERIQQRLVRFNYPGASSANGAARTETSTTSSPAFATNHPYNNPSNDHSHHMAPTSGAAALYHSSLNPYPIESFPDQNHMMMQSGLGDINMQSGNDLFNPDMMSPSSGSEWMTLPIDTLLEFENPAEISTNAFGPEFNGMDMLDVLLKSGNSPN